jgi:hypothetical protein
MMPLRTIIPAMILLLSGCSTLPVSRDTDLRAQHHFEIADSLERANALRDAAFEYAVVAEHYAGTTSYQTAVYRAALLYSDPSNPGADDSTAARWLAVCSTMDLPEDQARTVRILASVSERIRTLREQVARLSASSDALAGQAKKQNATLGSQSKRIQELEEELHRTGQELRRLKEIDLRMSRSRQKK